MNNKINISVFAVPLSGNKGSASMFYGLRDAFMEKNIDVQFNLFSYYPSKDKVVSNNFKNIEVYPGHPRDIILKILPTLLIGKLTPRLLPVKLKKLYLSLKKTEVFLLVGGTTFSDSMLYKVPWNVLAALPGYILKKPSLFLSQTLGPFNKTLNLVLAKWTLKRANRIHGRGRMSENNVTNIGVSNCIYMPDLSFNMKVPIFSELEINNKTFIDLKEFLNKNNDRLFIGFTPNSIVYKKAKKIGKDYLGSIRGAIEFVQSNGHIPVLIPHSYREESASIHNNDRSLCNQLMLGLKNKRDIFYVDADLSPMVLRSVIGQMHILVASRFHSMISALSMGVPPVTLGWGYHKYVEVLNEFGLTEYYMSFNHLEEDTFYNLIEKAIEHREDLVAKILKNLPDVQMQAADVTNEILQAE